MKNKTNKSNKNKKNKSKSKKKNFGVNIKKNDKNKMSKETKTLNQEKLNILLQNKEKELSMNKKKSLLAKNNSLSLRDRMLSQLKSSRFRFLNEQMYNSVSHDLQEFFKKDPDSFYAYHEGYNQQVNQWPIKPLDVIIKSIKKMPQDHIIADFGCGEAILADSISQTVHSFDLIAINSKVTACDISHTPLLMGSVNVVVFCLSLMGTNIKDYLLEANRVLKMNGILKIAEVESRFDKIEDFINSLSQYGFTNCWKDLSHNLFYFLDFKKVKDINKNNASKIPTIDLKPCLYKKR